VPTALDPQQLTVLLTQLLVLLLVARLAGYAARRLGQPAVVGELGAGFLLGPSVFGQLAPAAAAWLFPEDPVQSGMLLVVTSLGVILLLVITGAEVDLTLVKRLLRTTVLVPVGSLVVPLAAGVGLGYLLPAVFSGPVGGQSVFAGFIGVALAVSAIPVVARILVDMGLLRRDLGQLTMVAAMADDLVGWVLLGVLAGLAADGGLDAASLAWTVGGIAGFLLVALTVGQRLVDASLRLSLHLSGGIGGALTVSVVVALVGAALTSWIGVEAVLGAFVAGMLLGRSSVQRREVLHVLELVTTAVFAPIFFATAGMAMDVTTLGDPTVLGWSLVLLLVASAAKLGGSWAGARIGGLDRRFALAVGVGLNSRGALGVVAASVALSLGVFSDAAYTAVVLMSVVTSIAVGPLLRWVLPRVPADAAEDARLATEALVDESIVISARRVLLPTRGGDHSRVAARVVDLVMPPRTGVTISTVYREDDVGDPVYDADLVAEGVQQLFGHRPTERRIRPGHDAARSVLRELAYGYDLVAIGASSEVHHPMQLSEFVRDLLIGSPVPVLLVRAGADLGEGLVFRRILTSATGTRLSRAAEEVAYVLGSNAGAEVDVVHVVNRSDKVLQAAWSGNTDVHPAARTLVAGAVTLAGRFGAHVSGLARVGAVPYEEVLQVASERGADTIVVGTHVRQLADRAFLGHSTEYLLEHAPQTLVVVAFPPRVGDAVL
jgi:Kef-type K+ transport system membrane component KefB/nucleotide-binding universal stress UspA family protein